MNLPAHITELNPEIYLTGSYLVVDAETTNLQKGRAVLKENRLLYTSMLHCGEFDLGIQIEGGELELSNFAEEIYSVDFIVAHNAKFELQWMQRAGIDISKLLIYDTMLGEYVLAGNRKWKLDLDSVAERYGVGGKSNFISTCLKGGVCPSEMPRKMMHKYCDNDVAITHAIFKKQVQRLQEEQLLPVMFTRCIFTPVVADMEMNGMFLDKKLVIKLHNEFVKEHQGLITKLDKITGGINMASGPQKAHFIYEDLKFKERKNRRGQPIRNKPHKQFPGGMPKTDIDTLILLKVTTKKQKAFMDLVGDESKLRKKISTYTSLFMDAIENNDCMLYGQINQTITATHRLSSNKPNLQNIDRELKKVITVRNSAFKIRQNDYHQLEYGVAGFSAQCPVVKADIESGVDAHSITASKVFDDKWTGNREDPGMEEVRREAKADTFKPLYGGFSGTTKQKAYYSFFMDKHTGIKEWHQKLLDEVLDTQKLKTITGLTFHFPGTEFSSTGYVINQTNIKNYPVQMFATADIAQIGTTLLWHEMKAAKLKSFIINEVHDSVVIEEHPDEHEIMLNLSETAMSKGVVAFLSKVYNINYNFPLEIDQETNTNWGWDRDEKDN